jgi:ABC-type glycerol-3-phosphate transport system permease component
VQGGALHAAGSLVMLPVLAFALLVQCSIVRGLVSSAFK